MANTLTAVIPKLLAQGLMALREFAVMPRLVNRAYESLAGQRGSTIDVPIPSAIAIVTVAPANTPPSTADVSPTSVAIALSEWKEAPFYLTDKDMLEAMAGTIPMQASEAVKAIGNNVDAFLIALGTKFYGFYGTSAVTPFGTPGIADATGIRKTLNKQLSPLDDRHVVMDPDAEAAALGLTEFANAQFSGSVQAILEGRLNRKLGASWWMDQNIATHTAGTATGMLVNDTPSLGDKAVTIDTGSGTLVAGDIVTFTGHAQTYVITAAVADVSAATIAIEPGLQAVPADSSAITLKATHVNNLMFHRDAIAFATRPLEQAVEGLGTIARSAVDPVTGLALRLEVTREHKRVRFSYDILYGAEVVRRELGARLAG